MTLTLNDARTIIDAATAFAIAHDQPAAICVMDATGRVISVDQLDGTKLHRDRMATGKARAAVILEQPTSAIYEMQETDPVRFHGLLTMFSGQIYLSSGGGVPIVRDGIMLGAIGIAGGKKGMDDLIAEAGINAWLAST